MQRTTQTLIALALSRAFAGSLNAAPTSGSRIYRPAPKYKLTQAERAQEDQRLSQISKRSQSLFALSSAEMALTKGDVKSALGLYIYTLNQTKSSDVAERAMDIAIETHNYPIAEAIYQEWRKIEPNPSAAQKRLAWVRALALGDTATIVGTLKETLASADEAQRSRAFLLLAQAALSKNDLLVQGKTVVHEAALQYPDLPESFGRPSEKVKLAPGKPGQFVRRRGEDVVTGQVLARAGERVTPALLGALASQGYARLTVAAGPRVLVCTGGDEILSGVEEDGTATSQELAQGQIFDANGPMLTAMLREDGAEVRRIAIGDDPIELLHRLTAEYESFAPDIIITSGGISHGKYEVVRNAIAKAHEADILVPVSWFGHVSQQPGGPQGVNVLDFKGHRVPMISFPGNPVSTLISYALILRPYLRAGGPYGVPYAVASEQATLNNAPRGVLVTDTPLTAPATKRQFLRGTLAMVEVEPGTYRVELYPDVLSGSHLLHRAAQADVLIELAPGTTYTGGEAVPYHRIRLTDN